MARDIIGPGQFHQVGSLPHRLTHTFGTSNGTGIFTLAGTPAIPAVLGSSLRRDALATATGVDTKNIVIGNAAGVLPGNLHWNNGPAGGPWPASTTTSTFISVNPSDAFWAARAVGETFYAHSVDASAIVQYIIVSIQRNLSFGTGIINVFEIRRPQGTGAQFVGVVPAVTVFSFGVTGSAATLSNVGSIITPGVPAVPGRAVGTGIRNESGTQLTYLDSSSTSFTTVDSVLMPGTTIYVSNTAGANRHYSIDTAPNSGA